MAPALHSCMRCRAARHPKSDEPDQGAHNRQPPEAADKVYLWGA